jgi:hypothetical protein
LPGWWVHVKVSVIFASLVFHGSVGDGSLTVTFIASRVGASVGALGVGLISPCAFRVTVFVLVTVWALVVLSGVVGTVSCNVRGCSVHVCVVAWWWEVLLRLKEDVLLCRMS